MSVTVQKETMIFSGDLTIQHIHEYRQEMKKALEENKKISIGFEEITSIDLTFLQLLCAFHREGYKKEKTITISTKVPGHLQNIMTTIGFERTISCEQGEHADCMWKKITEAEEV